MINHTQSDQNVLRPIYEIVYHLHKILNNINFIIYIEI